MRKKIDPEIYGLPPRTLLFKQDPNEFIIEINRKSRIVMKDAVSIVDKSRKIKHVDSGATITLETNAPVCSKSVSFLNENGLEVFRNQS